MGAEDAAPCRHAGVPPEEVIERIAALIKGLEAEEGLLSRHGLSAEEFREGLPMAIQKVRGSMSAGNSQRRQFMLSVLAHLKSTGLVSAVGEPRYGEDTVYRLVVPGLSKDVAVIQKGCPDGAHSSSRWAAPDWAGETYLWWLCDAMAAHPGEHVQRGVNRLFKRFQDSNPDELAGVIFHNDLCGGPRRVCPKMDHAVKIGDQMVPPPCVYVMPQRDSLKEEWNWNGDQQRRFPAVLLQSFGIGENQAALYTGSIGYRLSGNRYKANVISRYGLGRTTSHRS
ncbi:hypothetical protein [Streptomyces californicus]|uniref:hypothetical protein n=1 Tax=Streptomyces californicus TaxID=67351 RepID=UPI0033F12DCD